MKNGIPVGSIPLLQTNPTSERIIKFCQKALLGFGEINGITHTEVIIENVTGNIYFIETACRAPGGKVIQAYQDTFGVNLINLDQQIKAGLPVHKPLVTINEYAFWVVIPTQKGVIESFIEPNFNGESLFECHFKEGDLTKKAGNFEDVLATLYVKNSNYNTLMDEFYNIDKTHFVNMKTKPKPCLILVNSKRSTYNKHILERKGIDIILVNLCEFNPSCNNNTTVACETQYDFNITNDFDIEVSKFQKWINHNRLAPKYFCNPNESMQTIAQKLARKLGLPALSETQVTRVRDKGAMKELYQEIRIPCASYKYISLKSEIFDFAEVHGYPIILKPTNSDSCINTYKLQSNIDIKDISLDESISWMVEEYIEGNEYQICCIISNGIVLDAYIAINPSPIIEVFDGKMNANITLSPSESKPINAKKLMQKIATGLCIDRGYLHGEFFIKEDGSFIMSEIAARLSGCEVPLNHAKAYGFDFLNAIADTYIEIAPKLEYKSDLSVGDLLLPAKNGIVTYITPKDELLKLEGVIACEMHYKKGDYIKVERSSGFCSGYVYRLLLKIQLKLLKQCKKYLINSIFTQKLKKLTLSMKYLEL